MVFYGASGHAKVVIESWIESGGDINGIVDDNEKVTSLMGLPVVGSFAKEKDVLGDEEFIISIGSNAIRKKIVGNINVNYGRVIHPKTTLSATCTIKEGTVVMAHVVVNAHTVIGKHCILNTSSSVDHDCVIGDFVHIAPGTVLCGNVTVGEGTLIGAGSVVLPGVKIGSWVVIGAGSVVTKDVGDHITVAGNPAKRISFKQTGQQ
ncbi:acetyltransferase [soil metagenome]